MRHPKLNTTENVKTFNVSYEHLSIDLMLSFVGVAFFILSSTKIDIFPLFGHCIFISFGFGCFVPLNDVLGWYCSQIFCHLKRQLVKELLPHQHWTLGQQRNITNSRCDNKATHICVTELKRTITIITTKATTKKPKQIKWI